MSDRTTHALWLMLVLLIITNVAVYLYGGPPSLGADGLRADPVASSLVQP